MLLLSNKVSFDNIVNFDLTFEGDNEETTTNKIVSVKAGDLVSVTFYDKKTNSTIKCEKARIKIICPGRKGAMTIDASEDFNSICYTFDCDCVIDIDKW